MTDALVITLAESITMKELENIKEKRCVEKLRLTTSQLHGGVPIEKSRFEETKTITLCIR